MLNKLKQFIKRFFLIDDTPQKVAGGAALGIFLGIFPGEGVLSALFFSAIFRLNKLSATAGVLATNMWTTFLVLPVAAVVGSFLFNENYSNLINRFYQYKHLETTKEALFFSLSIFSTALLPLLVGFFIIAGTVSVGFYFILIFILKKRHIEHLKDAIRVKK
ncbi:MAG: DUF2062 domain-containing protein [Parcubacteria group bacterium]|jgi:uncharacterized protein (DUF2062 family)